MSDEAYMKLALEYAEKGRGWVKPNPMVGTIVVKNDRVIGMGYHARYGGPHAEQNAPELKRATRALSVRKEQLKWSI